MRYEGTLFRPPSEARSYILQATIGCSHNLCTYCDMYRGKDFRERDLEEVFEDIREAAATYPGVKQGLHRRRGRSRHGHPPLAARSSRS